MKFSEESLLLIKNWQTYEYICQAGERLKTETIARLQGIEKELRQKAWWTSELKYVQENDSEFFIAAPKTWQRADTMYRLAIGFENFQLQSIFGENQPPFLYVWIRDPSKHLELIADIRSILKLTDEVEEKPSQYIIQKTIPKLLPGDAGKFEELAIKPIIEWFDLYGPFIPSIDKALKRDLARQKK